MTTVPRADAASHLCCVLRRGPARPLPKRFAGPGPGPGPDRFGRVVRRHPYSAALSDRFSRHSVVVVSLAFCAAAAVLFLPPLESGFVPAMALAFVLIVGGVGAANGPQAAIFSELLSPGVRYSGLSIIDQVDSVVGAGGLDSRWWYRAIPGRRIVRVLHRTDRLTSSSESKGYARRYRARAIDT